FSRGDEGTEMYGVVTGAVELRNGDEVVERLEEDGVFGEMDLIDHSPRNLSAVAVEDTEVAVIDNRLFLFLVHEPPTFAVRVRSTLPARLRALNHEGDAVDDAAS